MKWKGLHIMYPFHKNGDRIVDVIDQGEIFSGGQMDTRWLGWVDTPFQLERRVYMVGLHTTVSPASPVNDFTQLLCHIH